MAKEYPSVNYEDYRSSRNPYASRFGEYLKDEGPIFGLSDANTEKYRGKWRSFFQLPENAELELELGSYHGETMVQLAQKAPARAHLAVEWKYKQCYKAAKKAKDSSLKNLCFLRANMSRLPWVVAPGEVNRVFIFFPDPWSKGSQQKWRVLHPGFFRTLGCLLSEGAELYLKTDHQEYATYIQESLAEAGCFSPMTDVEAAPMWERIPPTPFEKIFLRQGLAIYPFALRRNGQRVIPPQPVQGVLNLPVC